MRDIDNIQCFRFQLKKKENYSNNALNSYTKSKKIVDSLEL